MVGVSKLDDTTQVNGQTLKLNGAGVRYKVVFKVYVAAGLPGIAVHYARGISIAGRKACDLGHDARSWSNDDLGRFLDGLRNNLDTAERTRLVGYNGDNFRKIFSTVPKLKSGDVSDLRLGARYGRSLPTQWRENCDHINDANFYNGVLKTGWAPAR